MGRTLSNNCPWMGEVGHDRPLCPLWLLMAHLWCLLGFHFCFINASPEAASSCPGTRFQNPLCEVATALTDSTVTLMTVLLSAFILPTPWSVHLIYHRRYLASICPGQWLCIVYTRELNWCSGTFIAKQFMTRNNNRLVLQQWFILIICCTCYVWKIRKCDGVRHACECLLLLICELRSINDWL